MSKTPKSDQLRQMREAKFERERAERYRSENAIIVTPHQPRGEMSLEPHFIGSAVVSEDGIHVFRVEEPKPLQAKRRGRPRKSDDGFDKPTYMRNYMRKRRAAAKEST